MQSCNMARKNSLEILTVFPAHKAYLSLKIGVFTNFCIFFWYYIYDSNGFEYPLSRDTRANCRGILERSSRDTRESGTHDFLAEYQWFEDYFWNFYFEYNFGDLVLKFKWQSKSSKSLLCQGYSCVKKCKVPFS